MEESCVQGDKLSLNFNDRGDCSKWFDSISYAWTKTTFFCKMLKTSRKGSLELQKMENWTAVARTELIEAIR